MSVEEADDPVIEEPEDDEENEKLEETEEIDKKDDDDENYVNIFMRRATLMKFMNGDRKWKHLGRGNLLISYNPEGVVGKIIFRAEETDEIISTTILTMDTRLQVRDKECTWLVDYPLDSHDKYILKAVFPLTHDAKEMYKAFEFYLFRDTDC